MAKKTAEDTGQALVDAPPASDALATEAPTVKTVPMVRKEPQIPGGPVTADVHPDEVDNFKNSGWSAA